MASQIKHLERKVEFVSVENKRDKLWKQRRQGKTCYES